MAVWMVLVRMVLILSLSFTSSGLDDIWGTWTKGTLTPKDPNMTVGSTLIMNCSLKADMVTKNYTASDIGFRIGGKRIELEQLPGNLLMPNHEIVPINATTAQLVHYSLLPKYNKKVIDCYVPKRENETELEILDSTYMHVGYPPFPATITDTLVLNWEVLKFSWFLTSENLVYLTKHHGEWKKSTDSKWQKCPPQPDEKRVCLVAKGPDAFDPLVMLYDLRVMGSNFAGNTSSDIVRVDAAEIVKANPVERLEPTTVSSRGVIFTFPYKTSGRTLVYEFSYTTKWSNTSVKAPLLTYSNTPVTFNLSHLVPFTRHEVSVRAKYHSSNVWSETTALVVTTQPDIPGAAPEVTPGGFFVQYGGHNTKDVYIFWKPVPQMKMNGRFVAYQLSYTETSKGLKKVETQQTWIKLTGLQLDQDYMFFINVRNTEGEFKFDDHLKGVHVPEKLLSVPANLNFTAIARSNNLVDLRWQLQPLSKYTVYWCKANHTYDHQCQDKYSISWNRTERPSFTVRLPEQEYYTDFLFGISLETGEQAETMVSSGIKWTHCAYNSIADIGQPEIKMKKIEATWVQAAIVPYPCRTSLGRAYIYAYSVVFCQEYEKETYSCADKSPIRSVVASLNADDFSISGLSPTSTYYMMVYSLSGFKHFDHPKVMSLTTPEEGVWATRNIIGMVIGGIFVLCLVVVGIFSLIRGIRWCRLKVKESMQVPVHVPGEEIQDSATTPLASNDTAKPTLPDPQVCYGDQLSQIPTVPVPHSSQQPPAASSSQAEGSTCGNNGGTVTYQNVMFENGLDRVPLLLPPRYSETPSGVPVPIMPVEVTRAILSSASSHDEPAPIGYNDSGDSVAPEPLRINGKPIDDFYSSDDDDNYNPTRRTYKEENSVGKNFKGTCGKMMEPHSSQESLTDNCKCITDYAKMGSTCENISDIHQNKTDCDSGSKEPFKSPHKIFKSPKRDSQMCKDFQESEPPKTLDSLYPCPVLVVDLPSEINKDSDCVKDAAIKDKDAIKAEEASKRENLFGACSKDKDMSKEEFYNDDDDDGYSTANFHALT